MRRSLVFGISLLFFYYCFAWADNVKDPVFSGQFYPEDKQQLSKMLEDFLNKADPKPIGGEIFALISPHAGFGYSGQIAAFGYKLIKGRKYKTVVILGTSHRYAFSGASVYPQGTFRTPLGLIEVDKEFAGSLLGKDPEITFDAQAFNSEHSVEVQLPFLQKTLVNFKIVPVVLGDCTLDTCKKLAVLLEKAIGKRKDVLIVVSTDLYHGYDYDEADEFDERTLNAVETMDVESLYYGLRGDKMQMCAGYGVVTALILSKNLGHTKVFLLKHTNSAEVTANLKKGVWTVGYTSCAIDSTPVKNNNDKEEGKEKNMLNIAQRKKLLGIARLAIESYLKNGKKPEITENDATLLKEMGAFVTLNQNHQLRGCIGSLIGKEPLYLTVRDMAVEAAVGDPRFSPLKLSELKGTEIEISVLSPMIRVDTPDKIEIGKHGVLVRKGFNSGVFLPQVATETGWSREEFLSNLCAHKAGLPALAWKDKSTELYIFTAEVFSEKEMNDD